MLMSDEKRMMDFNKWRPPVLTTTPNPGVPKCRIGSGVLQQIRRQWCLRSLFSKMDRDAYLLMRCRLPQSIVQHIDKLLLAQYQREHKSTRNWTYKLDARSFECLIHERFLQQQLLYKIIVGILRGNIALVDPTRNIILVLKMISETRPHMISINNRENWVELFL
jgi:hypothetical protein